MKKTLALLLALVLIVAMAPAAFATSETSIEKSTKLTTTVPGATYTLNVPKDTVIPYNALDTSIGYVTVTDSTGFATGKNLEVKLEYSAFTAENVSTTIPYAVEYSRTKSLTDTESAETHDQTKYISPMTFKGQNDGTVLRLAYDDDTYKSNGVNYHYYVGDLGVVISASAWGKALAGDYTSTITFTASVVAG